jgi:RimJ/RimL family protein N-acetyltransferase
VTPVIETERLRMRGRRLSDFPAVAAMQADGAVMRFIAGAPVNEEDAWGKFARMHGLWALTGVGFWLIEEKATGAVIGEVGLSDFKRTIDPPLGPDPEYGWMLSATAQRKGYGAEALGAALEWGDRKFHGAAFSCIIDEENAPSVRLAERHGFRRERTAQYKGKDIIVYRRPAPAWYPESQLTDTLATYRPS